jgi:aspartyl-tRNA(Asn)/glutamyl-tRNA(Gln) amidotransferase subunit C
VHHVVLHRVRDDRDGVPRPAFAREARRKAQDRVLPGPVLPDIGFFQFFAGDALMSVDAATVKRVAHLARIALPETEVARMQGEINAILGFVEELSKVNIEGVEPMTSVTPMRLRLREDAVTDGGAADAVLANAPMSEDHFFAVPKVVE